MRKNSKKDWRDIITTWVMWICWIVFMLWTIAKSLGWINTPVWVASIPYYAAGIGIVSLFLRAGRYLEKIDNLEKDSKETNREIKQINKDIVQINFRLEYLTEDVSQLKAKVF